MFEKVVMLFIGVTVIFMGIQAIFRRGYWSASWNRYIDYGSFHSVIGVIFLLGGLAVTYTAVKLIIKGKKNNRAPRNQ
jgi:hypothetical protein